ncbi:MAG TPA: acyl-CoA dehydrogenase family protein [Chitinophagales bacterium]|nr:acyl-CoA dehydrogenase family protein [Chitinophagales bacterium]
MNTETLTKQVTRGGEFLIRETHPSDIFIPEEKTEEQQMIYKMGLDFIHQEIFPIMDRLEKQEPGLAAEILRKAGELGILSASLPEEYGGFGRDYVTTTFLSEGYGAGGSVAVSISAHTGIGTLPILYFGTEEQKKKYLPRLATGELKASYCLTEPGSGSDALGAKTTAVLSADKKFYTLNGQKMWITNGGFADIFIVFAKIDEKFSALIVEASTAGVTRGEEEKKMGIKGSSTRPIFFQDAKVPAENLLGEIGKGHLIAFNILNIGRHRLAAAAVGGGKMLSTISVQYANQREQFKQPIANFGAIKHKLAEQAIRLWVNETVLYRTANDIENMKLELLDQGKKFHEALMGAAEEYAIECAILKVTASEMVDYVVDECVQIHGGIGYSEEYIPARAYRDARINRIFEGTNEINRLLSIDMLLKRALKGKLDLMTPATAIQKELTSVPDFSSDDEGDYFYEKNLLKNMKKAMLLISGAAVQKLMMQLEQEQEIIMNAADVLADIYLSESALLRVMKMKEIGLDISLHEDMLRVYLHDAMNRIEVAGRNAIESFADGDEMKMMLMGLKRFSKTQTFNCKNARRRIAEKLIGENKYCF